MQNQFLHQYQPVTTLHSSLRTLQPTTTSGLRIPGSCPQLAAMQFWGHSPPLNSPQLLLIIHCYTKYSLQLVGVGPATQVPRVTLEMQVGRAGFQEAMGCGWYVLQSQCSFIFGTSVGPTTTLKQCPENTTTIQNLSTLQLMSWLDTFCKHFPSRHKLSVHFYP